jgi:hypothetical protein
MCGRKKRTKIRTRRRRKKTGPFLFIKKGSQCGAIEQSKKRGA